MSTLSIFWFSVIALTGCVAEPTPQPDPVSSPSEQTESSELTSPAADNPAAPNIICGRRLCEDSSECQCGTRAGVCVNNECAF